MTGVQTCLILLIAWKFFGFIVSITVKESKARTFSTRWKVIVSIGIFFQILVMILAVQAISS